MSDKTGIHLKFDNGWSLSIQQSPDHLCTVGRSVEIAAWDADGNWYKFEEADGDTSVLGHVQPDQLANWIQYFSTYDLDKQIARRLERNKQVKVYKRPTGRRGVN